MVEIDSRFANNQLPMHLDVRDLKLVATTAQVGSLSRAADVLHLSQSTLSHHLSELETRVGTPLFYRTGRRLILTTLGERLRDEATPLLEKIRSLEQLLGNGHALRSRQKLRFATECYTTYSWFGKVARTFVKEWPDFELTLIPEATQRPLPALEHGDLDIAITTRVPAGPKFRTARLFKDELVAAVAPDHPWAASRQVSLERFRDVQLLTYSPDPMDSDFVREVLLPAGILPGQAMGIRLTEAMLEFAKAGLGVPVVPRWAAEESFGSGALIAVKIGRSGLHRVWNAVWLRSHPHQACLSSFAKLLRPQTRRN
ncbi:MAG TPA: LysR family transcriptional regulator [Vicinamibacterales bacterium]